MAVKLTFKQRSLTKDYENEDFAYFESHYAALMAVCNWNRCQYWEYVVTSCETCTLDEDEWEATPCDYGRYLPRLKPISL